jgi:hypothetical protein
MEMLRNTCKFMKWFCSATSINTPTGLDTRKCNFGIAYCITWPLWIGLFCRSLECCIYYRGYLVSNKVKLSLWAVNWERCRRMWLRPIKRPSEYEIRTLFASRGWETPRKLSVRVAGAVTEVRTRYLLNTCQSLLCPLAGTEENHEIPLVRIIRAVTEIQTGYLPNAGESRLYLLAGAE